MSHVDIRFTDKNSERFMLARRVYKVIEGSLRMNISTPTARRSAASNSATGSTNFHRSTRANGRTSTRRTTTGAIKRTTHGSATASQFPSVLPADPWSIS